MIRSREESVITMALSGTLFVSKGATSQKQRAVVAEVLLECSSEKHPIGQRRRLKELLKRRNEKLGGFLNVSVLVEVKFAQRHCHYCSI